MSKKFNILFNKIIYKLNLFCKSNQLLLALMSITLMILFYISLIYFESLMSAIFLIILGIIVILMLMKANKLSEDKNLSLSKKKTNSILNKLFTKLYYCCPNNIKILKDLYQIFILLTLIFIFNSSFFLASLMFLIAFVLVLKQQLALKYKKD